jgi:hypothetical protein
LLLGPALSELNRLQVSPGQVNEIGRALESMWANGHVTMTDFVSTVQDESIREVMREYTIEGSMGQLFDAPRDTLIYQITHIACYFANY